jgi:predicted transposase/invertase (TIGR01784 family)
LLKSFLNAMLPLPEDGLIDNLTYLPSEQVPMIPTFKHTVVDVKCTDTQGRIFIVEMQIQWTTSFMQRLLFGASTAYVRQLEKGESYQLLQPVYGLGLIADVFDKKSEAWYHHYKLINIKQPEQEIKDLQLVFIELPKFKAASIAHKKLQILWLRFMSELNNHTIEVPPEWLEVSEIKEAVSLSEEAAYTPVELAAYDKYWDAVSTEKTYLDDAKAEGKAEGIAEGEAMGLAKGIEATLKAISLIHQHVDDITIASQTHLDIDAVCKLRKEILP